jgi:hypothetical protein
VPADPSALVKQSLADMGLELVDLAGLADTMNIDKPSEGGVEAQQALTALLREALLGQQAVPPAAAAADPRVDQLVAELADLRARFEEILAEPDEQEPGTSASSPPAPTERAVQDFLAAIRLERSGS